MTNPILSNAVENKGVVLWQYDHAYNLIALIDGFNKIATATVTQFWDYFRDGVFNIMTADTFGLNVLGRLMGLPRPTYTSGAPQDITTPAALARAAGVPDATSFSEVIDALSSQGITESSTVQDAVEAVQRGGSDTAISDDFFRRLLLGRFFLFGMSPTVPNYNKYLNIIYGRFSSDILPVAYTIAGEPRTISEIAQLAIVETPASGGDSSDSGDDTPATLAVYDGRNNTFLFTMVEDASAPGKFVFAASNPAKGFSITFNGRQPEVGEFPATVNKARVYDGGADMFAPDSKDSDSTELAPRNPMAMSFVPLSPDGQAALDQLTPEERAMHEQHPDLIYFYPAGIRTNASAKPATNVIGTEGQPLENLADAFSWVQPEETAEAGGIFAGNEKAKYLDGFTEEESE